MVKPKKRGKKKSFSHKVKQAVLRRNYPLFLRGTTKKRYQNARKRGLLPLGRERKAPAFNLRPSQSVNEKSYVKRLQSSIYRSVDYALEHVEKPMREWMFLGKKTPAGDFPVLIVFKSPAYFSYGQGKFGKEESYHRSGFELVKRKGGFQPTLSESEPVSKTAPARPEDELAKFTVSRKEFAQAHEKAFKALKAQGFKVEPKHHTADLTIAFRNALREELGKILVSKIVKAVKQGKL